MGEPDLDGAKNNANDDYCPLITTGNVIILPTRQIAVKADLFSK